METWKKVAFFAASIDDDALYKSMYTLFYFQKCFLIELLLVKVILWSSGNNKCP